MLIRGMRSFGTVYDRNSAGVSDTIETIRDSVEFNLTGGETEMLHDFPQEIYLQASINPIPINRVTALKRIDRGTTLEVPNIYDPKYQHSESPLKTQFCAGVSLKYEDYGRFITDDEKFYFDGMELSTKRKEDNNEIYSFGRLKFYPSTVFVCNSTGNMTPEIQNRETSKDEIFRMDFAICNNPELCEYFDGVKFRTSADSASQNSQEEANAIFYPCGGFYCYGSHPQLVEQCVCRGYNDKGQLKIKSYCYSMLGAKNIRHDSGKYIFPKFREAPNTTLYHKIQNGECEISVVSKGGEEVVYKSCGITQVLNTDLVNIKFIIK